MISVRHRASQVLNAIGLSASGFFTPYRYTAASDWARQSDYPEARRHLETGRDAYRDFLGLIAANRGRFDRMRADPDGPVWDSRFLSALDCAAIYTAVGHFRPARIVEIGAGHTTRFMARAIRDFGLPSRIVAYDPAPRIPVGEIENVDLVRRVLLPDDAGDLAGLSPGELLFVDSSHILQQGFDVDIILNRILPALRPGVIVHFHDVFLPYGYPPDWEYLRFNEQCALMPWLLSGRLGTIFPSHYVWRDMRDDLVARCAGMGLDGDGNGGSFFAVVT